MTSAPWSPTFNGLETPSVVPAASAGSLAGAGFDLVSSHRGAVSPTPSTRQMDAADRYVAAHVDAAND